MKKIISAFLSLIMLLSLTAGLDFSAYADDFTEGNYRYQVNSDGTATIIQYNGNETSVEIPDIIGGHIVTAIGAYGGTNFSNDSFLKSIFIPKSITSINVDAFCDCYELENITVDSDNEIYDSRGNCNAIIKTADNSLLVGCKNTSIPDSVESIGYCAFFCRTAPTVLNVPEGVTSIEAYAFYMCRGLQYVTLPESLISIGDFAFSGCQSLAYINLPDNVTYIGEGAFGGTAISSIIIPSKVTTLKRVAFSECQNLKKVVILGSITTNCEYAFNESGSETIIFGKNVTTIPSCLFSWAPVKNIYIPKSVKTISRGAFYDYNQQADIYYDGSEDEWNSINIDINNEPLNNATFHFNSSYNCFEDEHIWGEETVITAPTCTGEGKYGYTCQICSAAKTETVGKLAHSYVKNITDPTCIRQGYTTYTCSVCGDNYVSDYINATGVHSYNSTVTTPATCMQNGIRTYTCSVCGDSYTDTIEATEHNFTNNAKYCKNNCGTKNPDYIPNTYTVEYNPNGGVGAPTTQIKTEEQNINISDTIPTKSYKIIYDANGGIVNNPNKTVSCTFNSWNTNQSGLGVPYQPGAVYSYDSNLVLYAQWSNPVAGALETPTREGYDFDGWINSVNGNSVTSNSTVTSDMTVVAVWVDKIKPTGEIVSTNNVSSSQTVTISLNDNIGVAGYYWGTNSNYSNNTYTDSSASSVSKSVSSAGMYYLTVKDTSGNLSDTVSVTFYKTTLNANKGSVSPTSVLTMSGNTFTLPTPTRNGYKYIGWNTTNTATNGIKSLTPISNITYYAIWEEIDSTKPTGSISSTNNVAASQTVTLSMSDDKGVAGYYWGTNSNYASNTYTASSATSVTNTVSAAGTYYLTVKDTSENLSNTVSVKFYKTTLNANSGSVSPTSVLTKSGNSFTFPTPTRSGYTYQGWNTSSSATSGVKSLTPTGNTTYYAVWTNNSTNNYYLKESEIYSFNNSSSHFDDGKYYVSNNDFEKLTNYVNKLYNNDSNTAKTVINKLQLERQKSWGGSCYGMAVTTLLDKSNQIAFNENFSLGAKTMHEVASPKKNSNVKSAINYYYIAQFIPYLREKNVKRYYKSNSNWKAGLESLISYAQKGKPMLFCYFWEDSSGKAHGHAIVIKGYKKNSDGSHSIITYDNRYPEMDIIIKINSNFSSCVVNENENANCIEFIYDMSAFDVIDIDGSNNKYSANYTTQSGMNSTEVAHSVNNSADISVLSKGTVTVENNEGDILVVEDGEISGTMDILDRSFSVNENENGESDAVMHFTVRDSNSFTFESTTPDLKATVQSKDVFGESETNGANYVVISKKDGVYLLGDDYDYSMSLSVNNNMCDMISLEGKADNDVKLVKKNDKVNATGVDDAGKITVFSDIVNTTDYNYVDGYDSIEISKGSSNVSGDVKIMASTGSGNGYNVSIGSKVDNTCNHKAETIKGYAPTCVDYGLTDGSYCSKCGVTLSEQKKIKVVAHRVVTDKAVAATFKKAGKTAGKHCSACGEILTAQKTVSKLGTPKLSRVKAGKKAFTAMWTKANGVAGYQVQYSLKKNFKGAKTKKLNKTKLSVKKLKSKKTYYVRVRAYKKINGKMQYSKWSTKKVKVK